MNNQIKRKTNATKYFAFTQGFLLVMSLFAFTFIISEVGVVSGKLCRDSEGATRQIPNSLTCGSQGFLPADGLNPSVNEPSVPAAVSTASATIAAVPTAVIPAQALGIFSAASATGTANTLIPENPFSMDLNIDGAPFPDVKIKSITDHLDGTFSATLSESITIGDLDKINVAISEKQYNELLNAQGVGWKDPNAKELIGAFGFTGALGHLVQGVVFAMAIVAAIQFFAPLLGAEESTVNALSIAAVAGVAAFEVVQYATSIEFGWFAGGLSAGWALGIGVAVAAIVFLFLYTKNEEKKVIFECLPWQAPTGGRDCEECNDGNLPCSEYQCRSLGQACEIINKGMVEEKCVWVNRQDVNPPEIKPLVSALLNNYRYIPDNTVAPPDRGVEILYENSIDNCIPAFTPLQFGVELNEPGACKIDVLRKQNFDEMRIFMSQGVLNYNHTFALSLPSAESLASQNITVENDGEFSMFVRCRDANGNSNVATFVFSYCIDQGPDTTPPLIVATNILNNMPIAFNQSSIDLEVYINEPSECKWSHDDRDYDSMEETMSCASDVFDFNAQSLYKCETTLTGLNDGVENNFFFRCRDKPDSPESDRNTNIESYEFTLIGTQPLVIDSVEPNNTKIKDSTDIVKVTIEAETSAGFNEGEAICYYSDTGNENDYIKFFETSSFEHSQDLFLPDGSYEYFIKCTDLGGNSDYETINFDIEVDLSAPSIVRVYKEENFLKLVTNENAECVYSTFGCNYDFNEGTTITVINGTSHFTSWEMESNLYVKCQDDFGNKPFPNQCSMTVRVFDF